MLVWSHLLSSLFILFGVFMECQVCIFSLNSLSGRGEPSSHQPALAAWVMMDAEWSEQVSDMGSGEGEVGIREMGWADSHWWGLLQTARPGWPEVAFPDNLVHWDYLSALSFASLF